MKIWKKWAALIIAVLMVFMAVACTPTNTQTDPSESQPQPVADDTTAAPTSEATDAPTTEATDATIDVTPFKDYLGTWYADGSSAGYRFIVTEEKTWQYADADMESIFSGNFDMSEEGLNLYDPEGSLAVVLALDGGDKVYVEIYTDSMMDMLNTSYFYKEILTDAGDFTPVGDGDSDIVIEPTDEIVVDVVPPEETITDEVPVD